MGVIIRSRSSLIRHTRRHLRCGNVSRHNDVTPQISTLTRRLTAAIDGGGCSRAIPRHKSGPLALYALELNAAHSIHPRRRIAQTDALDTCLSGSCCALGSRAARPR